MDESILNNNLSVNAPLEDLPSNDQVDNSNLGDSFVLPEMNDNSNESGANDSNSSTDNGNVALPEMNDLQNMNPDIDLNLDDDPEEMDDKFDE